ncbi:helix-turn-helix domain-containing protein [Hoyosella subflava]|uniref:Transcriptional regulatory protein n=1 Tax=Hoyosella subflava (strain DSM 45089 / JCM 17490 / NBRC 109087 / DQS3-9A1) TaxID=443218 RepID=F6EL55_HOYSD|nr:AraC family transcriptional regulator [Hoyosella subflava]AEF42718.1 Transcriptional regulatory protein [Hoyosella subflava DQS3-9A1]
MNLDREGVPPLVFAQFLESPVLEQDAVARFREIMDRERTDVESLLAINAQVPLRWIREALPDLDVDQATTLGLAFAQHAHLTSFGPLSVPLVSAGSAGEILELLAYLPLITPALSAQFYSSEHGVSVALNGQTGDRTLDSLVVTYCGAVLLRLLHMLVNDAPNITLSLSWAAPKGLPADQGWLANHLVFNAPVSILHLPIDAVNDVCRFSDPVAYRLAVSDLQRGLDERSDSTSYSDKVRRLMEKRPANCGSQWIAEELSISTSTLKRRLAEEGVTYRGLRQSIIREYAILRLLDGSMSTSEIAKDLGYSDLASFSHAFKHWTGHSPTKFRRR